MMLFTRSASFDCPETDGDCIVLTTLDFRVYLASLVETLRVLC